jgi:hypothetical protein
MISEPHLIQRARSGITNRLSTNLKPPDEINLGVVHLHQEGHNINMNQHASISIPAPWPTTTTTTTTYQYIHGSKLIIVIIS